MAIVDQLGALQADVAQLHAELDAARGHIETLAQQNVGLLYKLTLATLAPIAKPADPTPAAKVQDEVLAEVVTFLKDAKDRFAVNAMSDVVRYVDSAIALLEG